MICNHLEFNSPEPPRAGLSGMWSGSNTLFGRLLPVGIALIGVVGLAFGQATAQSAETSAPEAAQVEPAPNADASHALQVHGLVDGWVADNAIPNQRPAPIRADRVLGVRITLRNDGLTMGTGTAWRDNLSAVLAGEAEPGPINLIPMVERATFAAMRGVEDKLEAASQDAALRHELDDRFSGQAKVATLDEISDELLIDVQIAWAPEPIELLPDDPPAALFARFAPGYHGLIVHDPADASRFSAVWPATSLAQNLRPIGPVRSAVSELAYVADSSSTKTS